MSPEIEIQTHRLLTDRSVWWWWSCVFANYLGDLYILAKPISCSYFLLSTNQSLHILSIPFTVLSVNLCIIYSALLNLRKGTRDAHAVASTRHFDRNPTMQYALLDVEITAI